MNSAGGDVHVKLLNVAYVPGLRFNLFSLHAVMPICGAALDAKGAHLLNGSLTFTRRESGSYVSH